MRKTLRIFQLAEQRKTMAPGLLLGGDLSGGRPAPQHPGRGRCEGETADAENISTGEIHARAPMAELKFDRAIIPRIFAAATGLAMTSK